MRVCSIRKEEDATCWHKLNACHRALYPIRLVAPSELSNTHDGVPGLINY